MKKATLTYNSQAIWGFGFLLAILISCDSGQDSGSSMGKSEDIPASLPMKEIALNDLSAFQPAASNWQIAGKAFSDFQQAHSLEVSEGTGILVNVPAEENNQDLFTVMEHGDLELEIEFMMDKGSNSGIYFQGRYEIQIRDSWQLNDPHYDACGGIYQRWDESKPEGQEGYEGAAPQFNASKAPGLWQQFHILFRAPRFDASGKKIENARFEYVYHNGALIHENVELTGPTRGSSFEDEGSMGPLRLQGDHGPVAFRNIRYKKFGSQILELSNLSYTTYLGSWDYIPGFDTLTVGTTGQVESFVNLEELVGQPDHFAIVFQGELLVPVTGTYLFETEIDDGGDLSIDGQLVVHNEGDPGFGIGRGIIELEKGQHAFLATYYEEVWNASLSIFYEGPEIPRTKLASPDISVREDQEAIPDPLIIGPGGEPLMVRGFVNFGSEKRTHTISIGDPVGVHYSYDLAEGALLKYWKGQFADVTEMWRDRGEPQLLVPMNAAIEATAGVPVAMLAGQSDPWPQQQEGFRSKGYRIDGQGRPVFLFELGDLKVEDHLQPSADSTGLVRSITLSSDRQLDNQWYRLASAEDISKLDNGWFSVGGKYYLKFNDDASGELVRSTQDGSELLVPVLRNETESKIHYTLLW